MAFSSANLFSLDEVIKSHAFVVPEFQRGYAWTREQWRDLWEDVANLAQRDDLQHYGGTLMVAATGDKGVVSLVDGQQRMTSISLMLAALGAQSFPITFRDNEALQVYYDYYALGHKQLAPSLASRLSYYARNIEEASKYFAEEAAKLSRDARGKLAGILLHRFKLFVLAIRPEFDIHVAFETINNRGRPLSTLEKLKNRLIYLATSADDAERGRAVVAEVHRCWKSIYGELGAGKTLLDDDEFLRAHAMGWFRHEKKSEWLSTTLFDQAFKPHGGTSLDEIETYVRSLELAAACWRRVNEPGLLPPKLAERLTHLHLAPNASTRPLLLWALVRLAEASPEVLATTKTDAEWSRALSCLVRESERFGVMVLLANGRASTIGLSDINKSAYALAHPGAGIYQDVHVPRPPTDAISAVKFAADHMRCLVKNAAGDEDEEDDAGQFLDPRFPWPGFFDPDLVEKVVADRFRKGPGFYKWQFGKLMVSAWEDRLRGGKGRPEKRPWEAFAWDESIEHIYPQHPHKAWQSAVKLDGRSSEAAENAITNSLGNLLLLSRPLNSALKNDPYTKDGKLEGKRVRYASGSYSEVQVARLCTKWTVLEIAARGIAMFRHAQQVWDFELVDPDSGLAAWLPLLFGNQAAKVEGGHFSHGSRLTNAKLKQWVERFEAPL